MVTDYSSVLQLRVVLTKLHAVDLWECWPCQEQTQLVAALRTGAQQCSRSHVRRVVGAAHVNDHAHDCCYIAVAPAV